MLNSKGFFAYLSLALKLFVMTKMIELKEHINYPYISYFLSKVYEHMQNDTSIHIKDKNAIEIIKKLQLIHKFVTSIQGK